MNIRAYAASMVSAIALVLTTAAAADDSATPASANTTERLEHVKEGVSPQSDTDIDDTITDSYMRAFTGSKSRWSIASQFYYMGGAINNPFGAQRPNVTAGVAIPTASMLEGAISVKYNMTASQSLMVGTGLDWVTPFQGTSTPADYNRKVDFYNPYLTYQYLYKFSGVQSALQFQPIFFTQTSSVADGYFLDLQLAQNSVYEIGHTGLSLCLYTAVYDNPYFSKTGMHDIGTQTINVASTQADYGFYIDPFLEYQINEVFSLRTVFNFWNYDHWRGNPKTPQQTAATATWAKEPWTQSLGVGVKITRDIYLFPNVQFLPEQMRSDMTNVALYTFINVF